MRQDCYLGLELQRLRLLLERRIAWLRCSRWSLYPEMRSVTRAVSDAEADVLVCGRSSDEEEERYWTDDARGANLTCALNTLQERILADRRDAHHPVGRLSRLFGLSRFEEDVLLLCLAPELDTSFDTLYAYVQDDVNRRYANVHLASSLFRPQCKTLPDDAPVFRFGLVLIDSGALPGYAPASRALRIDARVGEHMRGVERSAGAIHDSFREFIPDGRKSETNNASTLRELVESFEGPACVELVSEGDTGAQTVAYECCAEIGRRLIRIDGRILPAAGREQNELLTAMAREARLMPAAFYLDEPQFDPGERTAAASWADFIERVDAPVFIETRKRSRWNRSSAAFQVGKPTRGQQRELWRREIDRAVPGEGAHQASVGDLVEQFEFGPEAIRAAVNGARRRTGGLNREALWAASRELTGNAMADVAQRIEPGYTWEDLILAADPSEQLREIAGQVEHRCRVYEEWGFAAHLSRGRGITALFAGPSGTGKTMAAEILARQLRLDLYRIDLAGVVNKYIGETEKNLRRVFEAAEQSGAILFFDEADALFGKRTEVKDSHDRYANIEINYLLQRMEDYRGLAILATNRKTSLDRAFLRRLRFLIDFPFPDLASRRSIWERAFPAGIPRDDLDFGFLARLEITGGNIRNICLNAAFLAASDGGRVTQDHVIRAVRREYAKIDKLVTESEFGTYYRSHR